MPLRCLEHLDPRSDEYNGPDYGEEPAGADDDAEPRDYTDDELAEAAVNAENHWRITR